MPPVSELNLHTIVASNGRQTDPTTSTVMADTGVILRPGKYRVLILISASASAEMKLQRRNAANDANVDAEVGWFVGANSPSEFVWETMINRGERLRVMMHANLTGGAWANLSVRPTS